MLLLILSVNNIRCGSKYIAIEFMYYRYGSLNFMLLMINLSFYISISLDYDSNSLKFNIPK